MERLRIDKWLWGARLFKTRGIAAAQVKAGHVRVNGQRAKPAHEIKVGDRLRVVRGAEDHEIVVSALPARRGPASQAAACYTETEASLERRRAHAAARAGAAATRPPTPRRPDKRTRRVIRATRRGGM